MTGAVWPVRGDYGRRSVSCAFGFHTVGKAYCERSEGSHVFMVVGAVGYGYPEIERLPWDMYWGRGRNYRVGLVDCYYVAGGEETHSKSAAGSNLIS